MDIRNKIQKEADLYKDLPEDELKKVIKKYKCLSKSNSDIVNFLFSLTCFGIPYFIFLGVSKLSIIVFLIVHLLFFWEYLHKYKKFKLVSDEDKKEIDDIILILEDDLKGKSNKKPFSDAVNLESKQMLLLIL
jgi:hypothetical protein